MEQTIGLAALVVGVAIGAFFFIKARKKKAYYKTGKDIDIPAPAVLRNDLENGYFTTYQDQVEEVANHVTLHWQSFWEGEDKAIKDMHAAAARGLKIVLDLDPYLFNGPKQIHPQADDLVGLLFMRLSNEGLLDKITVFTPMDEPNLPATDADHLIPQAVGIINVWRAMYPEQTANSKLGLVYYYMPPFRNLELFDIVGFDNYHSKSLIFEKGQQYWEFEKLLAPHQKTWLFAGGSYEQDPTPFYNFAHTHPRVWGVITFLYADLPHPGIGLPLRNNPARLAQYQEHGRANKETRLS